MVCLVINGDRLEEEKGSFRKSTAKSPDLEKELADHLTKIPLPKPWAIRSICLNINKEKTNVILGREVRCLYGEPYIEEQITGILDGMDPLTFRIGPLSFFQTNTVQTARLYETALSFAGLTGKETVWDLYCGTGTISLYLARKAAFVLSESFPRSLSAVPSRSSATILIVMPVSPCLLPKPDIPGYRCVPSSSCSRCHAPDRS